MYKTKFKANERPVVHKSEEVCRLWRMVWDPMMIELREEFKVMLLNRGNRVLGIYHASAGGISATVADPRLILLAALMANATSIILAHNHPSGSLQPSKTDEELTQQIKNAAKWFDIKVLDHIIISADQYYSFAEEGIL